MSFEETEVREILPTDVRVGDGGYNGDDEQVWKVTETDDRTFTLAREDGSHEMVIRRAEAAEQDWLWYAAV